jgi:hypothetical protein
VVKQQRIASILGEVAGGGVESETERRCQRAAGVGAAPSLVFRSSAEKKAKKEENYKRFPG